MANMIPISTVTVGSGGASTIEFNGIPQIYTDLMLKISGRTSPSGDLIDMQIRAGFGSVDTASNYNYLELTAIPSASIIASGSGTNNRWNTIVNASSSTSNTFGSVELYIPNYTSSNSKSVSVDAITENNSNSVQLRLQAWRWTGTSPINTITLTPASGTFSQYSSATLYGIRKY